MSLSQYETIGMLVLYGFIMVVAATLIGVVIGSIVGFFSGSVLLCGIWGAGIGGGTMILVLIGLILYARQMGWQ